MSDNVRKVIKSSSLSNAVASAEEGGAFAQEKGQFADEKALQAIEASFEALSSAGVNKDYISTTIGELPPTEGAVDGEIGAFTTDQGNVQKLKLTDGAWVDFGEPISTRKYVDDKASLLESDVKKGGLFEWNAEKHPSNPIVSGPNDQFYPPGIIEFKGHYYMAAKANGPIRMYKSPNGVDEWEDLGVVLDGSEITWGTFSKYEGTKFFYNPETELFYLINGIRHSGAADNYPQSLSLAFSEKPEGPYTDLGEPLIDAYSNDTLSVFGTDFNHFERPDIIQEGGEYKWYITAHEGLNNQNCLLFTSPINDWLNLSSKKQFFSDSDLNNVLERNVNRVQGPVVFVYDGWFVLTFTAGTTGGGHDERGLYVLKSRTSDGFSDLSTIESFLTVGEPDDWDGRRVYFHDVLKASDGEYLTPIMFGNKIRIYYSGHHIDLAVNEGVTGLAEYKIKSSPTLKAYIDSEIKNTIPESSGEFTPIYSTTSVDFDDVTYASQLGRFVKHGKLIHFRIELRTNSVTTGSANGFLVVKGLPGNINLQSVRYSANIGYQGDFETISPVRSRIDGNGNIRLYGQSSINETDVSLTPNNLSTGSAKNFIFISGTYEIE